MATRRWLPLVLASVVTAALAGTVALRALFDGSGEGNPHAQGLTPAPTATTSIAGTSTAEPPLTQVDPVLEKRMFAAGERVTVRSGIGFLSADTGGLETWSRSPDDPADYGIHATPDGMLLLVYGRNAEDPWHLVERGTGRTWRVAKSYSPVLEASHGALIAAVRNPDRALVMLDVSKGSVSEPLLLDVYQPIASPDGTRLAVRTASGVQLVPVASGSSKALASGLTDQAMLSVLPGGLGFTLSAGPAGAVRWFSWDGVELARQLPAGALSPNGRYIATSEQAGQFEPAGMGGTPTIGSIVVSEREGGRPVVQFLGADPLSDSWHSWSAASDAIVVQVAEGYLFVPLNAPEGPPNAQWLIRDDIHVLEPRPSPTIAGLLGTNRGTIINTAGRQTIAPLYAEEPWRARWTTRPGELAVELASPGKGRSWPLSLLPFEVRRGAPAELTRLVVSGGPCAGLLDGTEAGSRELDCLAPGTVVGIEPYNRPSDKPEPGTPARIYIGRRDLSGGIWVHVRTEDGETGWLRGPHLDWAP